MNVKKTARKVKNAVLQPAPIIPVYVCGVAVGVYAATLVYKPALAAALSPENALATTIALVEKDGLTLYALDTAQQAIWHAALDASKQ